MLRSAVLDGVPLIRSNQSLGLFEKGDSLLYVGEMALFDRPDVSVPSDGRIRIGRNAMLPAYDSKFAIGTWHYTTTFDRLDSIATPRRNGTSGAYVIADHVLIRDPTNANRSLSLFVQFGVADDRVNRFGTYLGAGLSPPRLSLRAQ